MSKAADQRFMRLAIALGARGLGRVWPNPAVGCVIVRDGVIVGRGWTQPGGRPHAEVMALAQAGARAAGAVAYVSLEPCAHHGKTGPCALALHRAGVARVVSALTDPDPRVAGRGHAMLRAAGIEVRKDVEAEAARAAQAGFLSRITLGRPLLTLKLALTLDGRIALATGESRWITGPEARRRVHMMRAAHDAVLIGSGTALADDPDLTVRDLGIAWQPVRVVADSGLKLAPESRLAKGMDRAPLWLACRPEAEGMAEWQARGAKLLPVAGSSRGLDPHALLAALGAEGLTRVFCEGGGALAASLLGAGLVDRLAIFTAGHAFGGDARAGIGPLLREAIGAPGFRLVSSEAVGRDLLHLWERAL